MAGDQTLANPLGQAAAPQNGRDLETISQRNEALLKQKAAYPRCQEQEDGDHAIHSRTDLGSVP